MAQSRRRDWRRRRGRSNNAAGGPGRRCQAEWLLVDERATPLAQFDLALGRQAGEAGAGGTHAQREWLPPRLERRVLQRGGERRGLDLAETRRLEKLREMPFARAREFRLVH